MSNLSNSPKEKTAFLCVGEGAQRVGMGVDFVPLSTKAADLFELAAAASGLEIFSMCAQGPVDLLEEPQNAMPCLVATSLAIAAALRDRGIEPDCVAGIGAGEYAAHALAQTIDEERALMLVSREGAIMRMARERGEDGLEMVARTMERAFKSTIFMQPVIPLYSSATGDLFDPSAANETMRRHITGEPLWDETIARMISDGVTRFIELGPGRRLVADVERIARDRGASVEAVAIGDALDLGLFQE